MFNLVIWAEIASLFILSLFGAHRLLMVVRYFLYRKAKPQCRNQFKRLPKVTVQIPIYNEWAIAQRVIEQVAKLDYPRECLEIQVLDDSTITACRAIAARAVVQLQEQGVCASHIVRDHRDGFTTSPIPG